MTTAPHAPSAPAPSADVLVVGAGPAGLFLVFELGLLGLSALVVDPLPRPGGQLTALYPDKPIYDIPALALCTGQELVDRLMAQIQPFDTQWALGQQVWGFAPHEVGWSVSLGPNACAPHERRAQTVRAVVIAAGVGAFAHRSLPCADLEAFRGHSVVTPDDLTDGLWSEASRPWPQRVWVAGSDDAAVDCALTALAQGAQSVTLLHRREALDASEAAMSRLAATPKLKRLTGQITHAKGQGQQLEELCLSRAGQADQWLPADGLIEALGLVPQLGPLADWGLAMHKKQIEVSSSHMATSQPGIYAVGDMAHYPGKRKLIVSAFHEATLAAYAVAEQFAGGSVPFEYTTASARLQARLGVTRAG